MENKIIIIIFVLIGIIAVCSTYKIKTSFPKVDLIDDYKKEKIVNLLLSYNSNNYKLHSSYRINGFGTSFLKISKFNLNDDKFNIQAKIFTILYVPITIPLGYIFCVDGDKIIATISKKDFKEIKEEIKTKFIGE